MSIQERRERERQKIQEAILDAALRLYQEGGYENVTIRKIASEIEYSPATLYLYYTDKEAIFNALREKGFSLLLEVQSRAYQNPNPLERLEQAGKSYLDFAIQYPTYYEIMFILKRKNTFPTSATCETSSFSSPTSYSQLAFEFLKNTVIACMEEKLIPTANPEAVSLLYWACVHGLASLYIQGQLGMFPSNLVQNFLYQAFDYLSHFEL
ncbi:MAG: TetR/AcrR family transcriptional regulator [Bacteroidia bacterium]|nr:TetR/AcrR family transcriptional regulator [Bacteroidia bacterium]MDW8157745.1 TetR/AcrR family transcriptional regulator [Bacteroidia bacterium]